MSRITDILSMDVAEPGHLKKATIGGSAFHGYEIQTIDGRVGRLAIIDEENRIVESGPDVGVEAWVVALSAYQRFLEGEGQLRVVSAPGRFERESSE